MRIIEIRRTCCGVPVWMLDTTCWSNSRLSGTEKLRSASMLLANDPAHSRWLIHERVPQAASALVESQVLDTHRALGSLAHALTAWGHEKRGWLNFTPSESTGLSLSCATHEVRKDGQPR